MGEATSALRNAVTQSRQEADYQRRRADRLAVTNRRLSLHIAWLASALIAGMGAMLLLGLVLGYAAATGLLALVRP